MLAAVAFAILPVRIKELVYGNIQQGDDLVSLSNRRTAAIICKRISGIGENKLRELMDNGELEYVQNGNRRLIADTAIWDWYERAKTAVKPPAEQGG